MFRVSCMLLMDGSFKLTSNVKYAICTCRKHGMQSRTYYVGMCKYKRVCMYVCTLPLPGF